MANGYAIIEVEVGPAMRTCLDVLDMGRALLELIPEWHDEEREELRQRMEGLADMVVEKVKSL